MSLQSEQISISRHDEVRTPGLGALKNTVVCLVTQHANCAIRSHDLGDAANLRHIRHDIRLGGMDLPPKRPGEFRKDGRGHNEGALPFKSCLIRFLGKPSKERRDENVGIEDYLEHMLSLVQNPIHVIFGANDKACLPNSPMRGSSNPGEFLLLPRNEIRFPHSSEQLTLGLPLLPGRLLDLLCNGRRNGKSKDFGRPSHRISPPKWRYTKYNSCERVCPPAFDEGIRNEPGRRQGRMLIPGQEGVARAMKGVCTNSSGPSDRAENLEKPGRPHAEDGAVSSTGD